MRLLTLLRPSETTHTTTLFHPSGPHVFERVRPQRWPIFLMTLFRGRANELRHLLKCKITHAFMVLTNNTSSSLYIVITMNNSVSRPLRYCLREYLEDIKSSGSQVAAVYLILENSSMSPLPAGVIWEGTGTSNTRFPRKSWTCFTDLRFISFSRATDQPAELPPS